MNSLLDVSVIDGWLPVTLTVLGVLGLVWLIAARSSRYLGVVVPVVAVVAAVGAFAAHWLIDDVLQIFPDAVPTPVYGWSALITFGVLLGIIRLIGPGWTRLGTTLRGRIVTAIAVLLVVAAGLMQINAEFGKYPTVGALAGIDDVETAELPATRAHTVPLARWRPPAGLDSRGRIATVAIPATASGFTARPAKVYLPPAYFTDPRPILPVIVMLAGQPGSPEDWTVSAGIVDTLDQFAETHHGVAPVVIMADGTGSEFDNPLCMDSRLGNADTYLTTDVGRWAAHGLDVETDRQKWAVGGLSYGGTCALQLATNHPDMYPTFLDMSGQWEPTLGDRSRTVDAAFGGDTAAFIAVNPVDLMRSRKYPGVAGVFLVGASDHEYRPGLERLVPVAEQSGMDVRFDTIPGGHEFTVWGKGFRQELPWLAQRLGIG
ncbi:alpha/beta hydrolase [Gordonia sp. NPDC003376]